MPSISLIRILAALSLALTIAAPAAAQDADAPAATEAPAKPKPRKAAPPKPAPAKPAATQAAALSWPTGASSLSEVYGDWTVTCAKAEANAKAECAIMQAQGAKGRREFALEIRPPNDGRAQGFILMPLGLAIEPGISFKLDEAVLGKGAPYLSCSQEGCLVPISLPTLATDTMKTAKNLLVSATKPEAKEPVTITVPLEGFANALARAIALTS
ncbi:invasion protein [Methylobacterium sp. Leaf125]|nr:invasion protein [Methylobacterium sp. Leaf125]